MAGLSAVGLLSAGRPYVLLKNRAGQLSALSISIPTLARVHVQFFSSV